MFAYVSHNISGKCTTGKVRHFQCDHCGTVHDFQLRCNKRFRIQCPDCSEAWKRKIITKMKRGIANMANPKFVTLTLNKRAGLDLLSIWNLRKYLFKVLRRHGHKIAGWLGVVEAPNHVHMVIDMPYLPQKELSILWREVTGDSYIVDIRAVRDGRGERMAANYLGKYLGKSQCWDEENLSMLKGFHLFNNNGLNLDKPIYACPCDCHVGPLRIVTNEEFEHSLFHQIDFNSDPPS